MLFFKSFFVFLQSQINILIHLTFTNFATKNGKISLVMVGDVSSK